VILYELLAGGRPFQSKEGGLLAYRILHEDPPRPSQRARQEGLPAIPADLDNVVMKAIAREPERRYTSAGALAEDLRRFLRGAPVKAHGDSTWYVASKFLRRYRIQSGVAAVFVIALIALGIQLAVTNDRLAKERDKALRERGNARQVSNFMVELFGNSERQPNPGQEITARQILDIGARSLRKEPVKDVELRANLHMGIGSAYQRIGQYRQAREQLDEAMSLLRGTDASASDARVSALIETSNLLERMGELAAAEAIARESVEVARQYQQSRLASALSTFGNSLGHQRKYAAAEAAYREGIALNPPMSRILLPLKANLAIVLYRQGKFQEAEDAVREVRQLMAQHWKNFPQGLAFAEDSTANLEALRGNYRAALAAFQEMLRILRETGGEQEPMQAHGLCGMAETYLKMLDPDSAQQPLAACAALREANVKPESFDAVTVTHLQGLLALQRGEVQLAVEKMQRAHAVLTAMHGQQHASQTLALRNLGMALAAANQPDAAESFFRQAIALKESQGGAEDPELADLMLEAGHAAVRAGKAAAGEARLRVALRIRQQLGVSPLLLHATKVDLADCLLQQGKQREAESMLSEATAYYQTHPPEIRGEAERALTLLRQARDRK
jgi:serine/threonine-protein kinase